MRRTRITTLAAAAAVSIAATLAGAAAPALASEVVTVEGFGSTLAIAQGQAGAILFHNYYGCTDEHFTDGKLADGTWWADIRATCQGDKVSG